MQEISRAGGDGKRNFEETGKTSSDNGPFLGSKSKPRRDAALKRGKNHTIDHCQQETKPDDNIFQDNDLIYLVKIEF